MKNGQRSLLIRFIVALTGTVLVAICCFTPLLVILLSLIGLTLFVPYLDYFLLPLLVGLIILTIISFYQWYSAQR